MGRFKKNWKCEGVGGKTFVVLQLEYIPSVQKKSNIL